MNQAKCLLVNSRRSPSTRSGDTSANFNNDGQKSQMRSCELSWMVLDPFDWEHVTTGLTRYTITRCELIEKKFVAPETRYPLYPEDLLNSIITYVPFKRARELLYGNGEVNPRLCALEIELHQRSAQTPGIYIGYFKDHETIETFSDQKEGERRVAELNEAKDLEYVVVKAFSKEM